MLPPPQNPLNEPAGATATTDRGQMSAAQVPSSPYCCDDKDKLAWRARMLHHSCPCSFVVNTSPTNHSMNSPWPPAYNPRRRLDRKHCLSAGSMEKPSKLGVIPENDVKKFRGNYQAVYYRIFTNSMNNLFKTVDSESRAREIKNNVIRLNIIRGKGVMTTSIVNAQLAARHHTYFYAYFVSLISKDFPEIRDLIVRRYIEQFKLSVSANDKDTKIASIQFISHLINLKVVSQILAVSLLKTAIQKPTEDAAEAILIVIHTCKKTLCRQSKKKLYEFLDTLPNSPVYRLTIRDQVEGYVKEKININNYFTKGCRLRRPVYTSKIPYNINFENSIYPNDYMIFYRYDEEFENTERVYELFREQILNTGNGNEYVLMYDNNGTPTTTKLLKSIICSLLQFPLMFDYENCAVQLMNLKLNPGHEFEICVIILEICSERDVFDINLGHVTQIICQLNRLLIRHLVKLFFDIYTVIHRHYSLTQIQNLAKFYAHLLYTETISLKALSTIRLDIIDITSSSGIFIKTLIIELVDLMAEDELCETLLYPSLKSEFAEIVFGKYEKSFSVEFCRSIGLNDHELTNIKTF